MVYFLQSTSGLPPLDDKLDSESSIFDTPKKTLLRTKLKKMSTLQVKHSKLIKSLKQKTRRLQKKNASLKEILLKLKKRIH